MIAAIYAAVFVGEVLGCFVLGEILATALMPFKNVIFKNDAA